MIKRFVIMAAALAVVVGGMLYFSYVLKPAAVGKFLAANKPPPTTVAVAAAQLSQVPKYLTGIGSVQAAQQVVVAPEVGGRIVKIFFQSGAAVKAGDPLVQLNDAPERGDLANFEAQARYAQVQLKRSKELAARQAMPQATVDQDQATLEEANAGIAKTQAVIAQKLIRAPFAGQLGIRQIDLGQYVNPGGAVVTLTNLDRVFVNFTLPEQDRSRLSVGQPVQVTADAFPGKVFEARLTTIEPQVSADTRTIKLQATLDNSEHLLLPGMFANAAVVLPVQPHVVTVPETAVDYSLYGDSVFVVKQDGTDGAGKPVMKVTRTFVKTGDRFNNRVAILQGLNAGDKVAASGQLRLISGMVVAVTQSDALKPPAQMPVD